MMFTAHFYTWSNPLPIMKKYAIKKTTRTGEGLFASKKIKKGEILFTVDLSKQKKLTLQEIAKMPKNNHADYVGRSRYVVSFHPYSFMNHSCNPTIVVNHTSIAKKIFIALRDIERGEELTYDYGANAMDQFGKAFWTIDCLCGNQSCRKKISGDFFAQPIPIQLTYYPFLPRSIKRKYQEKFNQLKKKMKSMI